MNVQMLTIQQRTLLIVAVVIAWTLASFALCFVIACACVYARLKREGRGK